MVDNIILNVSINQLVLAYDDIYIIIFENKALNVINELFKFGHMNWLTIKIVKKLDLHWISSKLFIMIKYVVTRKEI
jgi:hypothetical protein